MRANSYTPTIKRMASAIDATLASYDNSTTWATGVLAVEYAEAGGYMGSASAFESIDTKEFAKRLIEELEK